MCYFIPIFPSKELEFKSLALWQSQYWTLGPPHTYLSCALHASFPRSHSLAYLVEMGNADLLFKGDFRIPGDLCGLWWWPYQGRGLLQCHVEDHEKVSLIPKGFSMDGWLGLNAVDDSELLLIIYASGFCLLFRICLWKECYRWAGSSVRTQGKSGSCLAPGHHCSLMSPQLFSWMRCWWVICKIWVWHKCKSIFDF